MKYHRTQHFKFLLPNHQNETNNTFALTAEKIWKYATAIEW